MSSPTTIVCAFESNQQAQGAVEELLAAGISRESISVVAQDAPYTGEIVKSEDGTTIGQNMAVGGGLGALGGLLIGLGALAIPGIGLVVAAGPLAAAMIGALSGAAGGGLIGALKDAGVPDSDAEFYGETLRKGGTILTIHTDTAHEDEIDHILRAHRAFEVGEREGVGADASEVPETIDRHPMSAETPGVSDEDFRNKKLREDYDNG